MALPKFSTNQKAQKQQRNITQEIFFYVRTLICLGVRMHTHHMRMHLVWCVSYLGNYTFLNPDLFLFIFVLFSLQLQKHKLKKCRWCAWDLNPGLQDGRRRQNHGAMAATLGNYTLSLCFCTIQVWPDARFFCVFWHFQQRKICPKDSKIWQSRFKTLLNTYWISPKNPLAKLHQIWSHCTLGTQCQHVPKLNKLLI